MKFHQTESCDSNNQTRRITLIQFFVVLLLWGAWPATLQAASWTWTNNLAANWSSPSSWLQNTVPSGTPDIVFPNTLSATGYINSTVDITNLTINSIAFNYAGQSIYVVPGGANTNIIMAPGATITLNGTAGKRPRLLNGSGTVDLSSGITTVTNSSNSQRFEFNGADIRNGTLALLDNNFVTQNASSGTTAANLVLGTSAAGTIWNQQGSGGPIYYTGLISGPGVFQNNSSVTAILTNNANSFGQATIFANGGGFSIATLANKGQPCGLGLGTANFNVIAANVIGTLEYTGNSATIDRTFQKNPGATGIIQVDAAGQTLTTSGQLNSGTSGAGTSGYNSWTIQGNGNFTLSGSGTVITDGQNTSTGGHTTLVKNGNGTFTITAGAIAAHQGATTVNGGKLEVDGSLLLGTVTVASAGTLGGIGTVSNITASGTLAAGNGGSTDVFKTGSVAFGNGAGLSVSLGGTNCSSIAAGGVVTLGTLSSDTISLTVALTGAPVDGTNYVVLTAPSVITNGLFKFQGTVLTNGAQCVVNNQLYAEKFSINYTPTSVILTALNSIQLPQTITFGSLTWGAVGDADVDPGATASSGLAVSYASSDTNVATVVNGKIHFVGAGSATITASQPGNAAYYAATSVNQSLQVYLARQTITFPGMYQKFVGDADFSLAATASSGLPVTYTSLNTNVATIVGGKVHIVGSGIAKIQADQAGNTFYPAAVPVIKYFTVDNDGSVLWNRTPENQVFQYTYSEPYTWPTAPDKTGNATITPVAYLWIPETCTKLKGLIILENNVPEHMLVGHPALRKIAAQNSLGIVFFTSQSLYNFNTGYSMDAADSNGMRLALTNSLQHILTGLATVSGYPEVGTVPWLPMGESGALLMVVGLIDGAPGRCIAGACMQNPQGLNTTASRSGSTAVPMLEWKGTAYEWGQTGSGNNITTAWNTDGQYASTVAQRSSWPTWPLTMLMEAGTGHFFMSEQMVAYTSQYIGKICALRLPSGTYDPVTNRLNTIDVTTGYLADPPVPSTSDTNIYSYNSSPAITKSWFPDQTSAQAAQAGSAATDWSAATQLPNIASTGSNCTISKYTFNGISDLTATNNFGVTPMLEPVIPSQFTNSPGTTLAQSPAGAYTRWICGPLIANGDNTFHLCNDRSYGSAAYFMTIADKTNSPSSIRLSVQPVHLNLGTISGHTAQTITFNSIADVSAGTSSIALNAASSSGLPVSFSVISGPAVLTSNTLVFTKIPPGSKFPVKVTVRAWQWGNTNYNTATPVNQTFNLVKSTQSITFPNITTRSCGAPDFDPGATASSALPITYSSDNLGVATVNSNGTLHITGAGTADISASQPGDANFSAAAPVVQPLVVLDTAPPVIIWSFTNMILNAMGGGNTLMPDVTGTNYILAADACSPELTITQTPTNNAVLMLGTNVVVLAANDGNGNTAYSTNTVVVKNMTPPVVVPSFSGGYFSFTFLRARSDLNYIVEEAFDLSGPWITNTLNPGMAGNEVTVSVPVSSASRRFLRLKVTQP